MMILKITQRLLNGLLVQRSVVEIEAIFLLAEMYLYGTKYIAKDENHALHWYEKAARLGATEAQHQTAQCMLRGRALKLIINKHGCG
ncbi:hypothetical protein ACLK2I_09755 [Escherichia coli]